MVDSQGAYERGPDVSSLSLINGDRPVADRAVRLGPAEGVEGAEFDHAAALLQMGAAKLEAGSHSEAEDLFRRALEIGERVLGVDNQALVPAIASLASARIMSGKFDAAGPLIARALAASESGPAEHDPDLAIVLNELARLCLKQSAHALAEPLLLRMYELKRAKGEDHPEVATVLASLATVRQALGRHESAEQLWRRVLEIRERTLAPNHFALATALENLGEACAARGKIGEALQLLQRAHSIRELTLGTGHSSVRVSRDRIADLQLQAEGSLDFAALDVAAPRPERHRLLLAEANLGSSDRIARGPIAPPRRAAARVVEAHGPAPVVEPDFRPHADTAPAKPAPADYRELLMSIQLELEDADEEAIPKSRAAEMLATAMAALKQREKATLVSVMAVSLLVVLATVSRAWSESAQPADSLAELSIPVGGSVSSVSPTASPTRPASVANNGEKATATIAGGAVPAAVSSRPHVTEQKTSAKKSSETKEPARISIPKVSAALKTDFDSLVQSRTSARGLGELFAVEPVSATGSAQRLSFRDEPANSPQRAQLIGSLPTPRYPAQLQGVQGEVRVRFNVDPSGHPVMSSVSVVQSPNTVLTAAVLKVIPDLRFQPALSGGAESKAIADVVQLGFQFRPNE